MLCVAALSLVAACGAAVDPTISASADEPQRGREAARAAPDLPDGSLAALTAEVRQLRVAVEELARSQTETQALGVYLSAQQDRLQQADQQLAAARRELDSATAAKNDLEAQVADMVAQQSRATSPDIRNELGNTIKSLQFEQGRLDATLQQARIRADELSRVVQSEEDRWNDLVARLEALAR
jgi:chromosome segregation ATPase